MRRSHPAVVPVHLHWFRCSDTAGKDLQRSQIQTDKSILAKSIGSRAALAWPPAARRIPHWGAKDRPLSGPCAQSADGKASRSRREPAKVAAATRAACPAGGFSAQSPEQCCL